MTRNSPHLIAAVALLCATAAFAANFGTTEKYLKEFRLEPDGTLWIDNPIGNIEVIGTDAAGVSLYAQKLLTGLDQAALRDAREQTQLTMTGTTQTLIIKTLLPPVRTSRWGSSVTYSVKVPSTIRVKIDSQTSDHIRVVNISGGVTVKNVVGAILLENVTGPLLVESVNGSINYDPNGRPAANVQLSSVNGRIEVAVAPDASFQWVGQTIRGDFRTNLPVTGKFNGTTFRGGVNSGHGPTLTTATMMGNVFVLKKGTDAKQTQSVRTMIVGVAPAESVGPAVLLKSYRSSLVDGNFGFSTSLGNISVGQVRGRARVETRAGEVELGMVLGDCTVTSFGGPLSLGDIVGVLNARTSAGDVLINTARAGGFAATDGGMIRVLHAGAPMTLRSGGGDIIVRTASAAINAETKSGDVTITIDPQLHRDTIFAKTSQGSVILNVSPNFAADIDATVLTMDDDPSVIRSDFNGLQIRRDQVGKKTRIRATGKLNGGGDRVEIYAEDGNIRITGDSRQPLISPAQP